MDEELISLLTEASDALAVLNTLSEFIPNMNLFVSMYVRKEALLSSQIEGTQATLEDVLDPLIEKNSNLDVSDVINYIKATEFALKRMKELPLCNRLIKDIHSVLMSGVRSEEKCPGEFRHSQNWIGSAGSTLQNARYIPPNVQDMTEAMYNLEEYMNSDIPLNVLIQAALLHYQFETIHPFLDGNGRVGRLLITLFLIEKKVLSSPALYISYYLKNNRIEYYDRMSEVRNKDNYEQLIKFFLRAIKESARDSTDAIRSLAKLHQSNIIAIEKLGKASKTAMKIFDYIEKNPIIDIGKTAKELGLAFSTVSASVKRLESLGILIQTNNASRNKVFAYEDYLKILRKDT